MRHRRDHLPRAIVKLQEDRERNSAATALGRVEELYDKARAILDAAERDGRILLSLSAIAELRRTVELLAKLTGEIDERPAERESRITQEMGALIANAFIAVLADNSLSLDFDTQHRGREVAVRHLRAIAPEEPQTS